MNYRKMAALILACALLGGCTEAASEERPLAEQTALMVGGEPVTFREWNFYLRMNQMQWEKSYLELYGEDMWTLETGEDGQTLADELKDSVQETICRIHLTNQHAAEYGAALDEEAYEEARKSAQAFMETYHEALLTYAGADEDFVYERLCEKELSARTATAAVADFEPELSEEDCHREGICYVLISTTGLRDAEGTLTPFSEEEVAERTALSQELCVAARESGDLKSAAEAAGLTPIESDMGNTNENDGQEPRMLDAARALAVGEISDPVETEEGWFLVQHTNDYDEEGSLYWKEYLTELAREEESERIYGLWEEAAEIERCPETFDQAEVKTVLEELL